MPYVDNFEATDFIDKSVQATGTPDLDSAFFNGFQAAVGAISAALATYSSDLEALEAAVASGESAYTDPTFISGLNVEWVSTTQIKVTSGGCYTPATGEIVEKTTDTTLTPAGLVANTWYYVYAVQVSGSLSFEPSTTAPVLYMGTAKQKSGDASRRYVGLFRTASASTAIFKWIRNGDTVQYLENIQTTPFQVIGNGLATTPTTVSCASVVPPTARLATFQAVHGHTSSCYFSNSDANFTLASTVALHRMHFASTAGEPVNSSFYLPLNSSQALQYMFTTAPGSFNGLALSVKGYTESR